MRADRYRPRLAAALLLGGLAVALGAAALRDEATGAARVLLMLAHWAGLLLAWFVAVVGGATLAWLRGEAHAERLGRRFLAAALLAGLGAGQVLFGLAFAGVAALWGAPAAGSWAAAVVGALASAVALHALLARRAPVRLALSVGFALVVASAWAAPVPRLVTLAGAFAAWGLVQTWLPDAEREAADAADA